MNKIVNTLNGSGKIRIMFVCLGNICRSPAAHGVFESKVRGDKRFDIESSGLYHGHSGELPDSRMRSHARSRGYDLTHRARPFKVSDFDDYDMIVAMDHSNISQLRSLAPTVTDMDKIVPMIDFVVDKRGYDHIPDPYYEGAEGFELVLDLLEDGCSNMYRIFTDTIG